MVQIGQKCLFVIDPVSGDKLAIPLRRLSTGDKVAMFASWNEAVPVGLSKPVVGRRYPIGIEWNENKIPINTTTAGQHVILPNSNIHSMSVFDVDQNIEVGRYKVYSSGNSSPSRMCMSQDGVFYCANRNIDSVVEINYYAPRTDIPWATSSGTNELTYGTDVMTTWEYIPKTSSPWGEVRRPAAGLSYTATLGMRGVAIDKTGKLWCSGYNSNRWWIFDTIDHTFLETFTLTGSSSYGCIINKDGFIWSSNLYSDTIYRINTADKSYTSINTGNDIYSVGVDEEGNCYFGNWVSYSRVGKIYANGTPAWTVNPGQGNGYIRGVVGYEGNVFACCSEGTVVLKLRSSDGAYLNKITGLYKPYGAAIDLQGYLWISSGGDTRIWRCDPDTCAVLNTYYVGSTLHYSYSDFTGYSTMLYT